MNEMFVWQIWHAQWLRRDTLRTSDGRAVRVIFRGHWSGGDGPDFQDALIVLDDGPLLRGAVEIHVHAADWSAHGHHRDPAYDAVVLHVTLDETPAPCQRTDGSSVAHLPLAPFLRGRLEDFHPAPVALTVIDPAACPGRLAGAPPEALLAAVRAAGAARLSQKAAAAEASAWTLGGDEAVYRSLLDALGYSRNRDQMATLAERLPLRSLLDWCEGAPAVGRPLRLAALLLGTAGFVPWPGVRGLDLAPGFVAALEREWARTGQAVHAAAPLIAWDLTRIRPANHPARRLLGLAALLALDRPDAFAQRLFALVDSATPARLVENLTTSLWHGAAVSVRSATLIGADRATEIIVNALLPHALARAAMTGDEHLAASARSLAERLPAGATNTDMRAMHEQLGGGKRLPIRAALEQQGLLHLYRSWCRARRCYECPVARLAPGAP